ncbi:MULTISPECIES: flavin reductase family protein [unclassified Aeromicrobium]|uniref:flavin reductase family protein n=1 Tax=unclassified Aeromicrobium TaxID=2633570 RepID=UPI0006FF6D44|nr:MULTISPECIES: flavin reductase family protein [unclassified Aeromicrobium]KQO39903.1 reductase [Aeromicrobium sp. Leaf245]KQP78940.1 reductase [Aeromicrobium sp. Leaf289]KQP84648.1 reductase [Aeromicrobium sp. Leaf291]RYY45320.1 MAG: flavin reductase [Actinomycetales bacterium]
MTASVDQRAFRDALGRFASGVTVVTTVLDGVDHAMTASAFCSVSLEPPMVLVCSHRASRFHDAVLTTGTWGVSILTEEGRDASAWFADRGRPLEDQLAGVPFHRGANGAPLLDDALAWLECTTHAVHDGGDHSVIMGAVTGAAVRDGVDDPLLYYRSHYGTIVRSPLSEKTIQEKA